MRKQKRIARKICSTALAFTIVLFAYTTNVKAEDIIPNSSTDGQQVSVTAEATASVSDEIISRGLGSPNGEVVGNGVRLRTSPSTSGTVIELLYYGERVSIDLTTSTSKSDGSWYYVMRIKTGTWGWVSADYIMYWG